MASKYLVVSGAIFAAVASLHLMRLLFGWEIQVETWRVPFWISWFGLFGALALCGWACANLKRKNKSESQASGSSRIN